MWKYFFMQKYFLLSIRISAFSEKFRLFLTKRSMKSFNEFLCIVECFATLRQVISEKLFSNVVMETLSVENVKRLHNFEQNFFSRKTWQTLQLQQNARNFSFKCFFRRNQFYARKLSHFCVSEAFVGFACKFYLLSFLDNKFRLKIWQLLSKTLSPCEQNCSVQLNWLKTKTNFMPKKDHDDLNSSRY